MPAKRSGLASKYVHPDALLIVILAAAIRFAG